MRIGILGWGSLIWKTEPLQVQGNWELTGLTLPIEFSRVSKDKRLTLAIDHENGVNSPVFYILSGLKNLNDAIHDLNEREGKPKIDDIGYINLITNTCRSHNEDDSNKIQKWARSKKFDAAIWTDLTSNFLEKKSQSFSIETAITYLISLTDDKKLKAQEYIRNAPDVIETPLRKEINRIGWLEEY